MLYYKHQMSKEFMTKNLHIEHPEDTILTGDLSFLNALNVKQHISVKYDGAPSIVWGKNPTTGNQFVGTKSALNKNLVKICETIDDIFVHYVDNRYDNLRKILIACLLFLPQTDKIYQGDFIGFGGKVSYKPNTITYKFADKVQQQIIIAPHTLYTPEANKRLYFSTSSPLLRRLSSNNNVKFVQPLCRTWDTNYQTQTNIKRAKLEAQLVTFCTPKEAQLIKQQLNKCIRENIQIDPTQFDNPNLISYWLYVKQIKEELLSLCRHQFGPKAYILNKQIDAEGYVIHSKLGTYKLINREVFSHANFTIGAFN